MPVDLLTPKNDQPDRAALARIRGWVRELAELSDDDGVIVSQLACADPRCPPVETVVVIAPASGATYQHKLHAAAHDVRREDIEALLEKDVTR